MTVTTSMLHRSQWVLLLVLLFVCLPVTLFALSPLGPVVDSTTAISRHYDPGHIGHYHKCKNCSKLYHQPGDLGAGSAGTFVCQYCGYNNGTGTVTPPPVYPPVTPPYTGGTTADQIIQQAQNAWSTEESDRILLDGATRLRDVRGVIRLFVAARGDSTRRSISYQLDRSIPWMNYPDCRFIEQQYRLVGNDTMADELIVHSHRFVTHVTDLLRLTITLHNSYNAYRLLERIERQENITGNPALWEVRNHFAAASTFELADRILVSVMRYIHHKTELQQMAAMAHFSSTRNIINAWITQQHGSSWKQFEVTMQPWRNFMSTMEKIKGNPVTLSDQDIQYVNFSKIEEYIAGIEAGKVVESSAYYAKLQLLKERLLQEKAQGNVEILQLLERLEAFR